MQNAIDSIIKILTVYLDMYIHAHFTYNKKTSPKAGALLFSYILCPSKLLLWDPNKIKGEKNGSYTSQSCWAIKISNKR